MTSQRSVVFAEPVRTAIGTFGGSLKDVPAPTSAPWRSAPRSRAPASARRVRNCRHGQCRASRQQDESGPAGRHPCRPAGDGAGPDRQSRLRFGRAGDRLRGAGDLRSAMSTSPWPAAWRTWTRHPIWSRAAAGAIAWATANSMTACCATGLNDAFSDAHSGWHTEDLVENYQVTREAQDQWALRSQQRFAGAQAAGHFKAQIVPVEVPGKKGPTQFDKDEANRPDTTLDALARLKPAFRPNGTITAGNAPGLNDAAAAMVLADAAWAEKRGLSRSAASCLTASPRSSLACLALARSRRSGRRWSARAGTRRP